LFGGQPIDTTNRPKSPASAGGDGSIAIDSLMRAVLNGCEHGLCILDKTGRLLGMNRAAERLLGCREEELRGRAVPAELRSPGEAGGEVRWQRKDGGVAVLRCHVDAVREGGERLALLHLHAARPVAAEGPACEIGSNFRAILDTITDGVIVIDEMGIVQLFNPAAERLFGYRREEALGRNVKFLMPSPDRDRHDGYLANYRRTGVKKIIGIGREVQGQRKDGTVFPMYLSIGELREDGRRLFVGITHDLTRRKAAEDKLLILSSAVEQSPVAIMIADLEGRITYVNAGFSRLTGYSLDEVVGRSPRLLQSGLTVPEKYRRLWAHMRAGEEWHGEIQNRKKSGELYWALETITPIRDAEGGIVRYLAMQQDVTQQKRDREALQESEARFSQVAEMVGEWLWEQDAEGRYLYCSSAVRGILGYRPEDLVGKHYLELLTDEDRRLWSETRPFAGRAAAPFHKLVNHYRHRDGREIYTESTGTPIFDDQGRLVRWRGVDLDITARKAFEDALHLRDRAIEAANVGIVIADARQKHYPNIYVNSALARITGYSREELLGRNLRILQGPDTSEVAREKIRAALQAGTACEVVLKNYRRDGTQFWNELLLSPVRDETGAVTHYIGIQTDVTERRRAEEERHELEIAKQIQLSLLPKAPLRLPGIEIAGLCVPATHVGGDYFDYFPYGDNVDLVIADVSGHSVGAALIMAEMRSTLKAEIRRDRNGLPPPGAPDLLAALNEVLYSDLSGADLFITMFYLRYELDTRRLRYANAGHNRALLLRRNAPGCTQLDADGLILGIRREVEFEEESLVLEPDDRLLLYTDGVVEAQDAQGNFFGLSRLCRAFEAQRAHPPEAMIRRLLEELRVFRGKSKFQDDISMVALRAV
jgi:sigma-B regulation protein RsbU (phosphoserine phosphatase)